MGFENYILNVIKDKKKVLLDNFIGYSKEKEILNFDKVPNNYNYISLDKYENLLLKSYQNCISLFCKSSENKNINVLFLYIDLEGGYNGLSLSSIENEEALGSRISLESDLYSEGNAKYRFYSDIHIGELKDISKAYYSISVNHPINQVSENLAFDKALFEQKFLAKIGLNIIQKLELDGLSKVESFIKILVIGDMSFELTKELVMMTNPRNILKDFFIEFN